MRAPDEPGALGERRRSPAPGGAGVRAKRRGERRSGGAQDERDADDESRHADAQELARGAQREREQRAGRGGEREQRQPAAAEDGRAEGGGEQRLAAACGPQARDGDDPEPAAPAREPADEAG